MSLVNLIGYQTAWIRRWVGVCQGIPSDQVPPGYFSSALDFEASDVGALTPRAGFAPISTAAPDGKPIKSCYVADWDGTDKVFIATTHHVYTWVPASDAWTSIYTIVGTTADRMVFTVLSASTSPILVFGNGSDPLQKWAGTGSSSACGGGAPAGKPVSYQNYLAVFGISAAPGMVQFSITARDPDTWLYGGLPRFVEMRGRVTSVFPFSGLVIFSANRTELFSGDPASPSGLSVLSDTVGCVSHETVADCEGTLTWMSRSGVMTWNGGGAFPASNLSIPVSREIISSIRTDISRISWDLTKGASAVYDAVRKRYMVSAQLRAVAGGTSYWRTLVYDFLSGGWWPWSLHASAWGVLRADTTEQPVVISTTASGFVRKRAANTFKDVETTDTTYDYSASSGFWSADSPDADKIWRALTVCVSASTDDSYGGQRTLKFHVRGELENILLDDAEVSFSSGGFILGVNVLGDKIGSARGSETRVPVALRAKYFQFVLFGSGTTNAAPLTALGISFRPNVARPILVR